MGDSKFIHRFHVLKMKNFSLVKYCVFLLSLFATFNLLYWLIKKLSSEKKTFFTGKK